MILTDYYKGEKLTNAKSRYDITENKVNNNSTVKHYFNANKEAYNIAFTGTFNN